VGRFTKQAVDLYERLAQRNPDAFEPALATTCGATGAIYGRFEDPVEASAWFRRGVEVLRRLFLAMPRPFAPQMMELARDYGNRPVNPVLDVGVRRR